ncbi:MAG: molybdate ABC transporter substrate-binding protein [Deltaproteobacteria bacterium]|nr:MAG: molybdate ABC transporter substrate-binding protein [Deltaproteobacteria bacterium]
MRFVSAIVVTGLALGAFAGCGREAPAGPPLTVFAAASLRAVADDVAAEWGARYHREVRVSYGASSTLARQIDAGAGADVILSADVRWIDWLEARARLAPDTRRVFAWNTLVLVAPSGHPFTWAPGAPLAKAFDGKLALGDPSHVPAGVYAKQALERLEVWDALEGRVVAGADVRAALRYVSDGGAPAGIVYKTDALAAGDAVQVVATLPTDLHDPIRYAGAATASGDAAAAKAFLDWLSSTAGATVLQRYGFEPLGTGEPPPAPPKDPHEGLFGMAEPAAGAG